MHAAEAGGGNDISFDELMRQYREYERQQGVHGNSEDEEEGEDDEGLGLDEELLGREDEEIGSQSSRKSGSPSSAHGASMDSLGSRWSDRGIPARRAPAGVSRADILKSRQGRNGVLKEGTRGRAITAEGDRKAELREAHTPGFGVQRQKQPVSFAEEDEEEHAPRTPASRQSRRGSQRGGRGSRPSTRGSSIADRGRLDDEMMGDALYFGKKGFLDYSRRNLNSIPMGAYTGAALNGNAVLILWAHDNSK